jgi:hypothetical protein
MTTGRLFVLTEIAQIDQNVHKPVNFVHFFWLYAQKTVPLRAISGNRQQKQTVTEHSTTTLHSFCTVLCSTF